MMRTARPIVSHPSARVAVGGVLVVAWLLLGPGVARATAQEAVFLVRHAERLDNSQDSPLSPEGKARAGRLAEMLRDARITAVYATQFQRTVETARPLAEKLGLQIRQVPAADQDALLAKLRSSGPRDRVLVVSHADRLPALMKVLGYDQDLTLATNEYDNLFVVLPHGTGAPTVLRLRY